MKKICSVLVVLVLLGTAVWAQDAVDYPVTVTGDTTLVIKKQNSYLSPLDMPTADIGDRAGASDREIQWFRAKANLNVSSGTPGETEWFGVVSLAGDFNSPDNMDKTNSNVNEDLKKIELTNAFAMWRPEMLGGRPLGVAFGLYGIKQTANAAYSNIFSGDPDSDFPAYSIAALTSKPMVNVDFHISGKTGVGVAFVKGGSDMIKLSGQFDEATMMTGVVYAETEFNGLGLNLGYQLAKGNKEEIKTSTQSTGSSYDYINFDPEYTASAVNAQVTYNYEVAGISAKPFVGYNMEFGQEALTEAARLDSKEARNTFVQVVTGGASVGYKIGKIPLRLSGEYSKVINSEFNLLDIAIAGGSLDSTSALSATNAGLDAIAGAGVMGKVEAGDFDDVMEGKGDTVSAFSGLDGQYHLEIAADLSPKITLALSLNGQFTKAVSVKKITSEEKAKIAAALKAADVGLAAGAGQDTVCANVANSIATNLDSQVAGTSAATDWTDTMSYGLSVTYRF